MPKHPQNLSRSFKTRTSGMFRKAAELHDIDDSIRISIIVEKPGQPSLIFTTEEHGLSWPLLLREYIKKRDTVVKRPAHYQSLEHGISRGRVRIIGTSPSSPSLDHNRSETPDSVLQRDDHQSCIIEPCVNQGNSGGEIWQFGSPSPQIANNSSPLPKARDMVLPSELQKGPQVAEAM